MMLFLLIKLVIGLYVFTWLIGLRIIPNDKIGIVEKWWSGKGSLNEQIIALNGEAGYQPEVLRGGIHFLTPLMYTVHIVPLVTVPQGQIAYVFARDGQALGAGQTLGRVVEESNNYQDVKAFLQNGGQRGPQRGIIREGTYAFNLAQFIVIMQDKLHYLPLNADDDKTLAQMSTLLKEREGFSPVIIRGSEDKLGIITIHDGPSLAKDDIIAPVVGDNPNSPETYHNNFQDPEKFLVAGGFRGRQYQVLTDGTYFINKLFATVELIDKTIIEVGYVGVVVSYVGQTGVDSTGEDYKHGELVEKGCRGVWREPLMPGKYAFNTFAGKIIKVPTTNVILKWVSNQFGGHKYDENLKEVGLITKDAFEPSLPLSVVMHINYKKAPLVIQRFGDIKMLVDQTLDPMVSAYFKNIGQSKLLIELVHQRNEIQQRAAAEMRERFDHYNLEMEEVLIGTPAASPNDDKIEVILAQLRDRQIAKEQIATYVEQQHAAREETKLREAEAKAKQQTILTQSEIDIEIQSNKGKAEYQRSLQEASKIKALAGGEAERVKLLAAAEADKIKALAEAEADKEARVGIGKAIAIDEQVKAYGGPQYQMTQDIMNKFTAAIQEAKIPIVPNTVISMGAGNGASNAANAFELLLGLLVNERLKTTDYSDKASSPEVEKMKKTIIDSLALAEKDAAITAEKMTTK